jgi:3-oxoadipate enol-lactonase
MSIDRRHLLERYRTGMRAVLDALADITDAELDRPAPDGGWTARDVAHHLADSEANGFIRLRRLIAEDDPVIVAYDQDLYARQLHYDRPIASSLAVLRAVRTSSLELLDALTPAEWARSGRHSGSGSYSVDDWLDIYARHPHDHAAQIRRARGWERQLEVPGGSLSMQQEGSGPPVLLLHAAIVDSRAWDALVPLLTAAGHRVVRYDRRGFGRSITEDVPYSNRSDALAVLDALGIERAIVVGNSQGSQIAVDIAIEHPERVIAVVAVGPTIGGYAPEPTPAEAELFDQMERLEASGDPDAIAAFDVDVWVNGPGQPADRVPGHILEAVREMDRGIWDPPRSQGQPIRLEPAAAGRLDELTAPLLAVAGDLDVSDAWLTARYLAANAPSARAVLLPGVAHMIGMEAPVELARLIVELAATLPVETDGH